MFSILISEKGGETKRLDFDRPEITIGRVAGNDIVLPRGNISKRHSRIVFKDAKFIIVDLKSTNGTFVNGRKITSPLVVKGSDKIYVGDFIMTIEEGSGPSTSSTADIEGDGARPGPPPPPPPSKSRPFPPTGRGEATSMDMPTGQAEDAADEAASAKSPMEELPTSRPPLPPRLGTRPPLGGPPESARATIANEVIRDAAALQRISVSRDNDAPLGGLSPIDRPVLPSDRISDKATMMAQEGGRAGASSANSGSPLSSSPAALTPVAPLPSASATSTPSAQPPASSSAVTPPGGTPIAPPAQPAPPPPLSNRPALSRAPGAMAPLTPSARPPLPSRPSSAAPPARPTASMPALSSEDPQRRRYIEALTQVVNKTLDQTSLREATPEQLTEATSRIERIAREQADKVFPLPMGLETDVLGKHAIAELLGGGPLDDFLADDTIHEVAVASHDRIYIDRGTGQSLSDRMFSSAAAVQRAVHRMLSRIGSKLDNTLIEVRLEGGALLQAALPPHARVPSLVLKRGRKAGGRLQDLVNQGVLSAAMSEFLEVCMRERRNLVVSGYGRGVMLGALGGATSAGARVVTVEPVSEIDLSATHAAWIGLIGRGTEMRNVIGHAVRMHPDHLMITDVRGPEALEVAAALCGGQGVVVGVDAASAREALGRIEALARLAGESPSRRALREELAQAVNLAIHVGRTAGGAYRVMEISEVTLADEGGIDLIPVFTFKPEGGDGQFVATGHVPAFAG